MLEECRADGERGVLWEVRDRRRHSGPMFQHLILEAALTLKELCQSPFYRGETEARRIELLVQGTLASSRDRNPRLFDSKV